MWLNDSFSPLASTLMLTCTCMHMSTDMNPYTHIHRRHKQKHTNYIDSTSQTVFITFQIMKYAKVISCIAYVPMFIFKISFWSKDE